ncbi:MAG: polysaccharide biosynthesis tyrosine autokinase [Verrucomicrobiota bacterium]
MNLSEQQNEVSLHAVDYWQVIKNRYGIILLTLALVFMTASVVTYVMPEKYESTAVIQVKPRGKSFEPLDGVTGSRISMMTPQFFGTEFEIIRSSNSLIRVIDKLKLTDKWETTPEQTLEILKSIVKTQNERGTDLITIKVRYTDKDDAKDIAEEVAEAYKNYRSELENESLERGISELRKAVQSQEDETQAAYKDLTTLSRIKDLIYYSDRNSPNQGGLNEDQEAIHALQQFTELQSEMMQLDSQIKSLLQYDSEELLVFAAGLELPDNIIKVLYPQYLQLKREIDGLKASGYGNKHPTILSNQQVLDSMKIQLNEGVVNLRTRLQGQLDMIKERLAQAEIQKDATKKDALERSIDTREYQEAKRNFEQKQDLLDTMKLKLTSAEIDKNMTEPTIAVHDYPALAESPISPNVPRNLAIGLVAGIVLGVGIAFFLEYIDTSVKSLEDVERYLQVPVLAVIPKDVGVLFKQHGMSPDAEAYRILRTNIEFNRKNPEDNAITVVSGGAGEGKSTTLVNLAYICAQGGYTTLMIDADLRRPRLHTFFDINNSVGLTNYLTTELMLEDVILQSPVDNLYFMPSGILPADAAGILNSRRMSELIQDVKQRFDLVLVDSPPILGVSDASVLASEVDLTMIVVQHRKLPRNMLVRVKQAVENVGGHVIGVVLNNVDIRSDSQYQYYTSYYTYYAPTEAQVAAPVATKKSAGKVPALPSETKDSDLY